jgi:hypothetical protein
VRVKTEAVKTVTIGDVDSDGWLDLVCPSYRTRSSRNTLSRIFLGRPAGFSSDHAISLPTNSGAGSIISDFNFDGYPDVFFYCHRSGGDPERVGAYGDHLTDSFLYWGSAQGFHPDKRLGVPGRGPHFDFGVDLGNIYDRTFTFDYVSVPYASKGKKPMWINWEAEEQLRSSIKFQLRVAQTKEGLGNAQWLGPTGAGSYFTKRNSRLELPAHEWIQYRALLDTDNGAYSPILKAVEIGYVSTE